MSLLNSLIKPSLIVCMTLSVLLLMMSITVSSETPIENEDKKNPKKELCWYVIIECEDI